jgi:hypothetical protein
MENLKVTPSNFMFQQYMLILIIIFSIIYFSESHYRVHANTKFPGVHISYINLKLYICCINFKFCVVN